VRSFNRAITGDGRRLNMIVGPWNTGSGSACLRDMRLPGHLYYKIRSVTLDDILERYGIGRCKLLKIDYEGSEYEILLNAKHLGRIEYLRGEFHTNKLLMGKGFKPHELAARCGRFIRPENIEYYARYMAE